LSNSTFNEAHTFTIHRTAGKKEIAECTINQPWTETSFEATKGVAKSGPVASSSSCSTACTSGAGGSAGATSTWLRWTCSAFVLETLGFEFKFFGFVTTGVVSALVLADTWDAVFETGLCIDFLAATRGLLFSTALLALPEFAVLRGLSHDAEPFAEAAVAELAGLCRPSFGDLARVGGICKTKTSETSLKQDKVQETYEHFCTKYRKQNVGISVNETCLVNPLIK
jgi:hypothetical protein